VSDIVDNSFHLLAGQINAGYAAQLTYYSRVCYKDA